MSYDSRIALPEGYSLTINDEKNNNSYSVTIQKEIGRGGSCIVYYGKINAPINSEEKTSVIVKELYPVGLKTNRSFANIASGNMSIEYSDECQFESFKKHFCEGQLNHRRFYDCYSTQSLPPIFLYGIGNNTVYAISNPGIGKPLSQVDFEMLSINKISSIMESICKAIRKIHISGNLYLDCKPDNFFYYIDNSEIQANIYLFDFDTVISINDIKNGQNKYFSASYGWTPPEQKIVKDPFTGTCRYSDSGSIGYHTDIYSIGMVFFWLLTRRQPTAADLESIQNGSFNWRKESKYCSEAEPDVIQLIQEIAKCSINPDVQGRIDVYKHQYYLAVSREREKYQKLFGLTVGDDVRFEPIHKEIEEIKGILKDFLKGNDKKTRSLPISKNRFRYNSKSTLLRGRDAEIRLLTEMCNTSDKFYWVGISGVGGIGKSRLAHELCSLMIDEGWNVFSPMPFDEFAKNDIYDFLKNLQSDVLICLDYIKQNKDEINSFMKYIINYLREDDYKIRIVLIEREEKDLQIDDVDVEGYKYEENYLGEYFDGIIRLKSLSEEATQDLVIDYIISQTSKENKLKVEDSLELITKTLKSIDYNCKRPLYALFITDAWLNDAENLYKWDRRDALDYLLGREKSRLSKIIKDPQKKLDTVQQKNYTNAIKYLYALATILNSIFLSECSKILEDKFNISSNDEMLIEIMIEFGILDRNTKKVEGWVPDLIGEYFCIDYFNDCCENENITAVKEFIDLVIEKNLSAFVRYADMIYKDFQDIICKCEWLDVLCNIEFPQQENFVRKNQFNGCSFLKNITFKDRINTIEAGAFRDCVNLKEIILPSSLEIIEKHAFSGCKRLTKVLPEDGMGKNPSIIKIEDYAFYNCESLEEIIIPESVQEMGIRVFENCETLREIEIPRKIKILNTHSFAGCKSLESVSFKNTDNEKSIRLAESCFFDCKKLKEINGSDRISEISPNAFKNCVELKSIKSFKKLTIIEESAFWGCRGLEVIDLSGSKIRRIPHNLFRECSSLMEVVFPDNIEQIDDRSFFACKNLEKIEFKSGIKTIGSYAFAECKSIAELNMPASLHTIKSHAFENCTGIRKVMFKSNPKIVASQAFAGCTSLSFSNVSGLDITVLREFCGFTFSRISNEEFEFLQNYLITENVEIPSTVCSIGNDAFAGSKDENGIVKNEVLKSIIIPSSVKSIGERAFLGCVTLEIVMCENNTITKVGKSAFSGCTSLKNISGSLNVAEILDCTFINCNMLDTIRISGQLNKIGKQAFKGCRNLRNINIKNDHMPNYIGMAAFEDCEKLKYPIDANAIRNKRLRPDRFVLGGFVFNKIGQKEIDFVKCSSTAEIINLPDTCVDISQVAFRDIRKLKKVTIPNSINKLPNGVFKECAWLQTVELPAKINIPESAFLNCKSLKNILFKGHKVNSIPNGVTIGGGAFAGCGELIQLSLPDSLTAIKSHTFKGCHSLEEITIPKNVTSIGNYAFKYCSKLKNIILPEKLTKLGTGVFLGCVSLLRVDNLENTSLERISNNTFESCRMLETLNLPRSIEMIKGYAFKDCHNLKVEENFIPNTVHEIGEAAFQGCYQIESIRIPVKIAEIKDYTFKNCSSLYKLIMHNKVKYIGQSVFFGCGKLLEIKNISNQLKTLGISAFAYCNSIKMFAIPDTVQKLPSNLFKGCASIEKVIIPEHIKEIPADCFKDCIALKEVNLPKDLEVINVGAFRNCYSLEKEVLSLPTNLKELRESAFRSCDGIKQVMIPPEITNISSAVFEDCRQLIEVNFEHHISTVNSYAFSNCALLRSFPFELVDDVIAGAAFCNNKSLLSLDFSDKLRTIGTDAFRGCSGIKYIVLPKSLKKISYAAFRGNSDLEKVEIPETVTNIKRDTFRDCANLSEVVIKASKIKIESDSFNGCDELYYIELPKTSIVEPDAFGANTDIIIREQD